MVDPGPGIRPASGYAPIGYGDLEPIFITIIIVISYIISVYCLFKLWNKKVGGPLSDLKGKHQLKSNLCQT